MPGISIHSHTPHRHTGLITVQITDDDDDTAFWEEVRDLAVWCQDNNFSLNVGKANKLIVDYRKRRAEHIPIEIDASVVEQDESFKLLGVHIAKDLSWSKHANTVVKKARHSSTAAPMRAS